MVVGGLFSPVMRVLRCIVASRVAVGRQTTTGILLPVQREVNIRRRRLPGVLFCRTDAFGLLICEFRGSIGGFRQTGSGCLSDENSFARPEMT